MRKWIKWTAGLALSAGLAPSVWGQAGFPPAPPPPPPPPGAAAAGGGPQNLWSFLCMTPEQKQKCKDKLCKSQIGQLMNNGLKPIGALTGGLLGPLCPPALFEDLLKPADSAEGAAARIKADEAAAKARRAAVRYLGTVDCRYWPEARDALINALRADRNECVRWEAAMAMGSGCCCNKEILRALALVVSGSEVDGNPCEVSLRVRSAAAASLDRCLACVGAVPPPLLPPPPPPPVKEKEEKPPETPLERSPGEGPRPTVLPSTAYYHRLDRVTMDQVVREGRLVLQHHAPALRNQALQTAAYREGHTLLEVVSQAVLPTTTWTPQGTEIEPAVASLPAPSVPVDSVPPVVLPASAASEPVQPSASPVPVPEPMSPVTPPPAPMPRVEMSRPLPPPAPVSLPEVKRERPKLEAPPMPTVPATPEPQPAPTPPPSPPTPPAPTPPAQVTLPTILTLPPPPIPKTTTPTVINLPAPSMDRRPVSSPVTIPVPPPPPPVAPRTLQFAPTPTTETGTDGIEHLLQELRTPGEVSRRMAAAQALADAPATDRPEVVDALVAAIRTDPDSDVRVACIRTLARVSAPTPAVKAVFKEMQTDKNPAIQQESWTALLQLVTRSSASEVR